MAGDAKAQKAYRERNPDLYKEYDEKRRLNEKKQKERIKRDRDARNRKFKIGTRVLRLARKTGLPAEELLTRIEKFFEGE